MRRAFAVAARGTSAARGILGRPAAPARWFSAAAEEVTRERIDYDVVIVGAGPSGLSAAIRLKQLAAEQSKDISVVVIEKAHEVGAHIVSGNVFEPRALNELIPDWKEKGAPLETEAKEDAFLFLTEKHALPVWPIPPMLHNTGNYICSLSNVVRWLGKQAEDLGVDIFPATPAASVLYSPPGAGVADTSRYVMGVVTADMGIGKDGQRKDTFTPGMEIRGKQTLFAEGCRGSCSEDIMARYNLRAKSDAPTYGIGIKEVWKVPKAQHRPGFIQHSVGWPLDTATYGGTFLYHMGEDIVQLGMVVGLDYTNPYINPYNEFQRWKHHPAVRKHIEGGECIQYGARAINEGGIQSLPKLTFPGGVLMGCSAGFLNVPKVKGTHMAMKSGMVAAETVFTALKSDDGKAVAAAGSSAAASAGAAAVAAAPSVPRHEGADEKDGLEATGYETAMASSWVYKELHEVRNYHPSFGKGLLGGMAYSALSAFVLKGREPWTFHNTVKDADRTQPAWYFDPIDYPKPDGKISFDILTNLARSGTNHEGDQPSHLRIKPGMEDVPTDVSYKTYAGPEGRFCPAKVYEYPEGENGKLVINAQNCVHCKTCSIKTPREYIKWTVPEAGGGGPAYTMM